MSLHLRRTTVSLPRQILRQIDRIGAVEFRTRSEVLREAARHYLAARAAKPDGYLDARPAAIPDEDEEISAAEMASIRAGLADARAGRVAALGNIRAGRGVARRRRR